MEGVFKMGRPVVKGSTDTSTTIKIIDSTLGTPETGVVYNTAGIALWYRREGGANVAITEATLAALDSAHADGGFKHIGDGYYRLDLPDAAWATGANSVLVGGTVTGMIVLGNEHQLTDCNPYDAVRMGMTALPNAAADAAGGLPISDAGGLALDTLLGRLTGDVALASELAKVPKSDGTVSLNATVLAAIADAVSDEVQEGTITQRMLNRLLLAALSGKTLGSGTSTITIRGILDDKDRLVFTVDANNNRIAVITRDGS